MSEIPPEVQPQVQYLVSQGWRVTTVTSFGVNLERGQPVNHVLHLLLTVLTCGFWALPWAILGAGGGVKRCTVPIPQAHGSAY